MQLKFKTESPQALDANLHERFSNDKYANHLMVNVCHCSLRVMAQPALCMASWCLQVTTSQVPGVACATPGRPSQRICYPTVTAQLTLAFACFIRCPVTRKGTRSLKPSRAANTNATSARTSHPFKRAKPRVAPLCTWQAKPITSLGSRTRKGCLSAVRLRSKTRSICSLIIRSKPHNTVPAVGPQRDLVPASKRTTARGRLRAGWPHYILSA